eukprot:m.216669 g.216669  ORF g.216669 m.216669 type:complete len:1550 (+) comp39873_c0_seq26:136-4785(+)
MNKRKEQGSRRLWNDGLPSTSSSTSKHSDTALVHDEYISQLQEKNRLLRKLREKDEKQIEIERKEQGFSVYVNGANSKAVRGVTRGTTRKESDEKRPSKTAGGSRFQFLATSIESGPLRAKTAPVKRRGWNTHSLEIKTQEGGKMRVQPPEKLTGNYEDDFEAVSASFADGELVKGIEELSSESESEELTISLEDVSALRRSLEADDIIGKLAGGEKDFPSEEEDELSSPIEEVVGGDSLDSVESSGEDEKISQSISSSQDMVVLSFASTKRCHPGRHLTSAKRRTDINPPDVFSCPASRNPTPLVSRTDASLTGSFAGRLSRPLSKERPAHSRYQDDEFDVSQIQQALAATQSESDLIKRASSAPTSAPTSAQSSPRKLLSGPPPSPLTDQTVVAVTEKVRLMNERQQKRLLRVLGNLEEASPKPSTARKSKEEVNELRASESSTETTEHAPVETAPAVLKSEESLHLVESVEEPGEDPAASTDSLQSQSISLLTSTDGKKKAVAAQEKKKGMLCVVEDEPDVIEVHLELLSNWGHSSLIGLTEVQLFDSDGRRMWLGKNRVQLQGMSEGLSPGNLGTLVNGKTKTTNAHYMWSCPYSVGQRLELVFTLPAVSMTMDAKRCPLGISCVKIWNYNGGIGELGIGVKEARLFLGTELVWKGFVNKGCGNQVFDYSTLIDLALPAEKMGSGEEIERCQTVLLKREETSPEPLSERPLSSLLERSMSNPCLTTRDSIEPVDLASVLSSRTSVSSSHGSKPVWFQSIEADAQRAESRASESRSRLHWLRGSQQSFSHPDLFSSSLNATEDDPLGLGTPFPRSRDEKLMEGPSQLKAKSLESKRESSVEEALEEVRGPLISRGSPRLSSKRRSWKDSVSLEESFLSLAQFHTSHQGRLVSNDAGPRTEDVTAEKELEEELPRKTEVFVIPELPTGRRLTIDIRSTWGDQHYVGLNGIEVFSSSGKPVEIKEISANPADINVLPEYGNDPRVVQNLLDGVNRTRDDMHVWLAPFTQGESHIVSLEFSGRVTLALVRVWNYNKSRIHSSRGARRVLMKLDGTLIFDGEIARACGGLVGGSEAFGDTILFTTEEDILGFVAQFDDTFQGEIDVHSDDGDSGDATRRRERPETADANDKLDDDDNGDALLLTQSNDQNNEEQCICGRFLQLNFRATWGDPYYIGLTGLEVTGTDGSALELQTRQLQATPRDLNDLPEYGDDCRVLENLVDNVNLTMSDEHMWLAPFTEGSDHLLTIDLGAVTPISGMRVWNYNKSPEDVYRGAQTVVVTLDDQLVSPPGGFLIRKGPGNTHFDFGQTVHFGCEQKRSAASEGEDSTAMPTGFVFQFQLMSTWGDPYYIGINGLEIYDNCRQKIDIKPNNVAAFPNSVNVLDGVSGDVRTPDRLIDGVNDTFDGRHSWLAPVFDQQTNLLYVCFDLPVTVSMIRLWNYSKTASRGVKEFSLLVDGLLVFHGFFPAVPSGARGILPTCPVPASHSTILFDEDPTVLAQEKRHVIHSAMMSDVDVQWTDDSEQLIRVTRNRPANPSLRPQTSVTGKQSRWN